MTACASTLFSLEKTANLINIEAIAALLIPDKCNLLKEKPVTVLKSYAVS